MAIHPWSSITGGPSPPVSRRKNSPRPGTGRCGRAASRSAARVAKARWACRAECYHGRAGTAADLPSTAMAVVIASDLGKDIAGEPLLRGISFKLERRDRMTLSGRNGAGKTTLLRMLAGEASIDGGELVLAKGAKVALHDQRPPRERDLSLRDYVLAGARELVAIESELAELEPAMAGGAHDEATLADTPMPRLGSSTPAATAGASGRWRPSTASDSPMTRTSTARWPRSPAASSRAPRSARALAGDAGPAAARRADQPPRHRVAGMARAAPRPRSTRRSSSSPTTAGSWRRSGPRFSSSRRGGAGSSPGHGTPGGGRRRPASSPSAGRSSVSRRRSSASSGSSPASGPGRGPARPSRGRSGWTGSSE